MKRERRKREREGREGERGKSNVTGASSKSNHDHSPATTVRYVEIKRVNIYLHLPRCHDADDFKYDKLKHCT